MEKIDSDLPLEEVLQKAIDGLVLGAENAKHDFHFCWLATVADDQTPDIRTVVLRKVTEKPLTLYIFTDHRSNKIGQLLQVPHASLVCYDGQSKVQIKVRGKLKIHHQDLVSREFWKTVRGSAKKSYATRHAPGTVIQQPEDGGKLVEDPEENFSVIALKADELELLQLSDPFHLRAIFKLFSNRIESDWITP